MQMKSILAVPINGFLEKGLCLMTGDGTGAILSLCITLNVRYTRC